MVSCVTETLYTEACCRCREKGKDRRVFFLSSRFFSSQFFNLGLALKMLDQTAIGWDLLVPYVGGNGLSLFDDVSVKHSWPSDVISHFRKSTRDREEPTY